MTKGVVMGSAQSTGLIDREEALKDLSRRGGQMVTIHFKDENPTTCTAYAICAGLRTNGQPFGYFIWDGRPHVITGQPDSVEVEYKYFSLQEEKNFRDLERRLR